MSTPSASETDKRKQELSAADTAKTIADIARAAGKSVPLLGMSKELASYILKTSEVRATFKSVAQDPLANPIALAKSLDVATSKEWRSWLPETLQSFCKLTDADVQQLDKVMACQVAVTNTDVFDDWTLFCVVNSAFNHRRSNFDWLDKPSYLEAAWTCYVLQTLRPGCAFGSKLIRFLCAVMIEDGLVYFPWAGDGILLDSGTTDGYVRGLVDCAALTAKVKAAWDSKALENATVDTPGITETDAFHVQLAKLIAGKTYIHTQDN